MGSNPGSASQGDLSEQLKLMRDVDPVASTGATHTGAGIDRQTFGAGLFQIAVGVATGSPTGQTVIATLQDSADNSTFANATAVTGLTVLGASITTDSKVQELGGDLSSLRRYIRLSIVTTLTAGTSPTLPVSSVCALSGADLYPA